MLWLKFNGHFQCRLATDPDPTDERRGVSGYVHALAGEPDLDRIIRLQPEGMVHRSHCPTIGVKVRAVFVDGVGVVGHPLVGADVSLLDEPKFEGRNWIVAEDGVEPIVPFHIRISKGQFSVQRAHADSEEFPFSELKAQGLVFSPGEIGEATGVWDLAAEWGKRVALLQTDLAKSVDETEKVRLRARIAFMTGRPPRTVYYPAKMPYNLSLKGTPIFQDPDALLNPSIDLQQPWSIECWFGAWDPDGLSGFVQGYLGLPLRKIASDQEKEQIRAQEIAKRMDHKELRRL
jgi:hypothetical protein